MTKPIKPVKYGANVPEFGDNFIYITQRESDGKFAMLYLINTRYTAADVEKIREKALSKYETLAEALINAHGSDQELPVRVDPDAISAAMKEYAESDV